MESHANCNRGRESQGCAETWMVHVTADDGGSSGMMIKPAVLNTSLTEKKDNSALPQLNPLLNIGNTFTKRKKGDLI